MKSSVDLNNLIKCNKSQGFLAFNSDNKFNDLADEAGESSCVSIVSPVSSASSDDNHSEIFEDDLPKEKYYFLPTTRQYADVDIVDFEIKPKKKVKQSIQKLLLRERISGKSLADHEESPYLDNNALTRGEMSDDDLYKYRVSMVGQCQKSAVWFLGQSTGLNYIRKIDCRKAYCPDCGGAGGKIHKNRMHSVFNRVDVEKYNLRQFVFTIPEEIREKLKSRENLNKLIGYTKQTIEKYFGNPVLDKKGHVKKYQLNKGVIMYLHIFGDNDDNFKPHVNIHILEDKNQKLVIEESTLNSIKKYWHKKLKNFDETLVNVDVHYSFRNTKPKKLHAIKYMTKSWGVKQFENQTEEMKKFLVNDLSGFQYLRYWGSLSNCNYKDEYNIKEEKITCESKCGEKLLVLGISSFNELSWKNRMIYVDDGFYIITRKVVKNHEEKNDTAGI